MDAGEESPDWKPIAQAERYTSLDALRGLALLGVLIVNLLVDFRISLAEHFQTFHTHPDWTDRATDVFVAFFLEFKAFTLFSLLFGVGIAVFAERAESRGVKADYFLFRRLLVLLALGLCHLIFIWNGDVLTLYAMCGFLLLPFLRMPTPVLAILGIGAIGLSFVAPWGFLLPDDETLHRLADESKKVYSKGSIGEVMAFHWQETRLFIVPLLIASLPKTWGLMALGIAAWKSEVFRMPEQRRGLLRVILVLGAIVGGSMTAAAVYSASTREGTDVPPILVDAGSYIPLAFAYAAAVLLAMKWQKFRTAIKPFAVIGQMALTNYLSQSIILGFVFYGYGLGLFGQLGSFAAAMIGLLIYTGQVAFSWAWLRHYRFGPMEWLWRSLTYGRRQPMRLINAQKSTFDAS